MNGVPPPDLIGLMKRLGGALEAAGIEYALGGALAFNIWAQARGTKDIDIATYVGVGDVERVFSLLQQLGADVERSACCWELKQWGHFEVTFELVRVDVFLPDLPLYDWAYPRRRRVRIEDAELWFWSAEDVLLFKLVFFRDKDKLDIKVLLKVQGNNLDFDYIRKALREILDDEERTKWFEDTVREILKG